MSRYVISNFIFSDYLRNLLISLFVIVFLLGCNNSQDQMAEEMKKRTPSISDETRNSILTIKEHRILFAHHSVGNNILDGLKEIADESGIDLTVSNINDSASSEKSTFIDMIPGKNQYPKSKVDDFSKMIKNLNDDIVPDIAFMKFCFVDFNPDTNIDELFEYYKKNIEELKRTRPEIKFVHLTVPLVAKPETLKSRIKRLLGLSVWEEETNIIRAKFNNRLLNEYPNDPVFDIARIESTRMDGSRDQFIHEGKTYYNLVPEYTDDGSHLNKLGRRVAAEEMAIFLANTVTNKK